MPTPSEASSDEGLSDASSGASEELARWPPRGTPPPEAKDAAAGLPARLRTGESEAEDFDLVEPDSDAEFPSVEEEIESTGLEERARWEAARGALLDGWAGVAAEAARLQVEWEREKAAEDAQEQRRADADAADWTPAARAEARREGAAVGRAAAAERARWKAFAEGIFAAVSAAILKEPL